ncbi:GNAT family N-acetyltransferase [Allomuricauda sp. d1]|uniref:GNAT family N-acetyltransferase n=1 Tax=Allomuricauda sp. d1 TaxID=3136725 RepID=UPI0031D0F538
MNTTEVSGPIINYKRFGKFKIRHVLPSDNEPIKKLILEVWRELKADKHHLSDPELDNMFEAYHEEKSAFWVLTVNDKIIGTIGIQPLRTNRQIGCELKKFYIKKSWRGFGMGWELIECCLAKARELKYQECYLETDSSLKRAGKIYERLGFVPIAEGVALPFTKYRWHKKNLINHDHEKNFKNE